MPVNNPSPDDAAILGIASALYRRLDALPNEPGMDLSEVYGGYYEFMRQCMRVAREFENWACRWVDFDELDETWPYCIEDKFVDAYLATYDRTELGEIILDEHHANIANAIPLPLLAAPRWGDNPAMPPPADDAGNQAPPNPTPSTPW